MKPSLFAFIIVGMICSAGRCFGSGPYPLFEVDPRWPKELPHNYIMANHGGITVDKEDHVWVITRQKSLDQTNLLGASKNPPTNECCRHAPAVIEFDEEGNFVQGWGGPYSPTAPGPYEWPEVEHGIAIDPNGHVWICGASPKDNHCIQFTRDGKFLRQIGHAGQSKGSLDTENFKSANQIYFWPKTNEAFVSDGYGNRRIVVMDIESGKFKRMWGAYGNKPDDSASFARVFEGPGPQQFSIPHGVQVSNDEKVYVVDRRNNRLQVFTPEGKFLQEVFVSRATLSAGGTASGLALSGDKEQRFLYVADLANYKVRVFQRATLAEIPEAAFGHAGPYAGQFMSLHLIAADSKGNIFTSEATGARIQKWVFKGLSE